MIPSDITVGVLMGGFSRERVISFRSGNNVADALERNGYKVVRIDPAVSSLFDVEMDICFSLLHGSVGEDGGIQALLRHKGIPFVGSGVGASVLGMNKWLTKQLFMKYDIQTPPFLTVYDLLPHKEKVPGEFPLIVKPFSEGSSVDVSIVDTYEELSNLHTELINRYGTYMIEAFIEGTEVTASVIEKEGVPMALPLLELRPKNRFYDYEAKYTAGLTEFVLPAELPEELSQRISQLAVEIHKAFDCRDYSRSDFMISKDGQAYAIELNTLPGMTPLSDLPAQAKCAGIEFDELVHILVQNRLCAGS